MPLLDPSNAGLTIHRPRSPARAATRPSASSVGSSPWSVQPLATAEGGADGLEEVGVEPRREAVDLGVVQAVGTQEGFMRQRASVDGSVA